MIRLILHACAYPYRGQYEARSHDATEIIVRSHQPLADGARELIKRGADPATLLTARHAGKAHDSFTPASLAFWTQYTFTEGPSTPLRRQRWRPRPEVAATPLPGPVEGPLALEPA